MKRLPTTQQITWFLDLERNKQLDLNPPYQRRSVWSPNDRRFFLDTIFRNYPTPPIFMHRTIDDDGFATYHVVDGKQRLETILSFAKDKIGIAQNFGDETLNGKKFNDLSTGNKRKFWDYTLVVDFLEVVDGTSIDEVFDRVNRNARNLQPQELRHARYNGWLLKETETENEDSYWWDLKVNTRAKDKRMRNEQFISELLLIILTKKMVGFSQEYLDDMYSLYEVPEETVADFDEEDYKVKKTAVKEFIRSMEAVNKSISTYGKTAIHFYTLWCFVAKTIEQLDSAEKIAERYLEFMVVVGKFAEASIQEEFPETVETELQFKYFKNSKGASTDSPQRTKRLEALSTFLLSK